MRLSLIIPCFNEEEVLNLFMDRTAPVIETIREKHGIDTEYIFINDGSTDGTLAILKQLHAENPSVHYISFSRNFGKEAALYAGLEAADGDFTAMMDADLQDPPEMLIQMADILVSGRADCAAARRMNRDGEPFLRSWFARRFYSLINRSGNPDLAEGVRDYRMMTKQVRDAVLSMCEYNRFSKGIFAKDLTYYAIEGLVGYTVKPLEIAAWAGIVFFLLSMIGIVFIIVRKLIFGDPVAGWPSLVCIILFCSGVQLFCTGIIGQYLAKTYLEVKKRPVYIVAETDQAFRKM